VLDNYKKQLTGVNVLLDCIQGGVKWDDIILNRANNLCLDGRVNFIKSAMTWNPTVRILDKEWGGNYHGQYVVDDRIQLTDEEFADSMLAYSRLFETYDPAEGKKEYWGHMSLHVFSRLKQHYLVYHSLEERKSDETVEEAIDKLRLAGSMDSVSRDGFHTLLSCFKSYSNSDILAFLNYPKSYKLNLCITKDTDVASFGKVFNTNPLFLNLRRSGLSKKEMISKMESFDKFLYEIEAIESARGEVEFKQLKGQSSLKKYLLANKLEKEFVKKNKKYFEDMKVYEEPLYLCGVSVYNSYLQKRVGNFGSGINKRAYPDAPDLPLSFENADFPKDAKGKYSTAWTIYYGTVFFAKFGVSKVAVAVPPAEAALSAYDALEVLIAPAVRYVALKPYMSNDEALTMACG